MIKTNVKKGHCALALEIVCEEVPDLLHAREMMQHARDTALTPAITMFFGSLVRQIELCLPVTDKPAVADATEDETYPSKVFHQAVPNKCCDKCDGQVSYVVQTCRVSDSSVVAESEPFKCKGKAQKHMQELSNDPDASVIQWFRVSPVL